MPCPWKTVLFYLLLFLLSYLSLVSRACATRPTQAKEPRLSHGVCKRYFFIWNIPCVSPPLPNPSASWTLCGFSGLTWLLCCRSSWHQAPLTHHSCLHTCLIVQYLSPKSQIFTKARIITVLFPIISIAHITVISIEKWQKI